MPRKPSAAAARAVVLAALKTLAQREARPDQLPEGQSHQLVIAVEATVGGRDVSLACDATAQVGHAGEAVRSSGPDTAHLVAYLLSLLPPARRERLLQDLPQTFDRRGDLPDVAHAEVQAAEGLVKRLRTKKTSPKAAAVQLTYQLR